MWSPEKAEFGTVMKQELQISNGTQPSWSLLTNHAHVLIAINRNRDARQTDIAAAIGITTGAVQRIINELEAAGYLSSERLGRRNRYTINGKHRLQHPLGTAGTVQDLINSIER